METAKRIMVLMIVTALATGSVQSSAQSEAKNSDTRTASCLVKVTCDPSVLPLNLETIDYLLHGSGVEGKAARQILDVSPDQVGDFIIIEYVHELISDSKQKSPRGSSPGMEGGMYEDEYAMMMEAEMGMMNPMGSRSSSRSSSGRRGARSTSSTSRTISSTSDFSANEQTFLFSLQIELPEQVKPLAKEFMNALIDNLRESLNDAYKVYSNDLGVLLRDAESRRDNARLRLEEVMKRVKAIEPPSEINQNPSDISVYERLEQFVDLSDLTQSTSFADVIEQLKTAVDPPLQIQPNWKDLLENAEVEQTTPAGMDPQPNIKLRKALEILLDGVSNDFAELKYVVDEGVILIATADSLPSNMVPRVYEIPALAYSAGAAKDLIDTIQNTIDPESWFEMSDMGEATITPYPSQRPSKLAILQTYENHQKIWKFLRNITIDIPIGTSPNIPEKVLLDDRSSLFHEKQSLEMELARLQGRMPAIETQIVRIKKEVDEKIQEDQVSKELKNVLDLQVQHLELVKKLAENGRAQETQVVDEEQAVARAKIELARRREKIGASAGTDQLTKLSNELATLAIDMAEKKAMLDVIKTQLDQTQQHLTSADVSDPQVSRIRLATQALEIAERRVNELNARLVNLKLPTVSLLGG